MSRRKDQIRQFLSNYIRHNNFQDNDHLFEKGYISSLMAMELVTFVERKFSIRIGNEDLKLENFKSVNDISKLVERKMAQ